MSLFYTGLGAIAGAGLTAGGMALASSFEGDESKRQRVADMGFVPVTEAELAQQQMRQYQNLRNQLAFLNQQQAVSKFGSGQYPRDVNDYLSTMSQAQARRLIDIEQANLQYLERSTRERSRGGSQPRSRNYQPNLPQTRAASQSNPYHSPAWMQSPAPPPIQVTELPSVQAMGGVYS